MAVQESRIRTDYRFMITRVWRMVPSGPWSPRSRPQTSVRVHVRGIMGFEFQIRLAEATLELREGVVRNRLWVETTHQVRVHP